MHKAIQWRRLLEQEDYVTIFKELSQLVKVQYLSRQIIKSVALATMEDLTQELFLRLQARGSWVYYIQSQATDEFIQMDIVTRHLNVVLKNELLKNKRATYRLAEKVLRALRADASIFRRIPAPGRKASQEVYGMADWPETKPPKDPNFFAGLIVNIKPRGTFSKSTGELVGISTSDLTKLLLEIMSAIDSPATVRELRQLAISKVSLAYHTEWSVETPTGEDRKLLDSLSHSNTPDQPAIEQNLQPSVELKLRQLLIGLAPATEKGRNRVKTVCQILWRLYFDPDEPQLLQVAADFGFERSSVSMMKRDFEDAVRGASFDETERKVLPKALERQLRLCAEQVKVPKQATKRAKAPSRNLTWFDELLESNCSPDQLPEPHIQQKIATKVDELVDGLWSPKEKARKATHKLALRCQILSGLLQSQGVRQIAAEVGVEPSTVSLLKRKVGETVESMSIKVAEREPFLMVLRQQLQSGVHQRIAA